MNYQEAFDKVTQSMPNRRELETVGKMTAIGLATYIVTKKLYDAYVGPLSGVPSTFYAKFFTISKGSWDNPAGTLFKKYLAYTDKYGPVAKLGPSTLLIADKTMIKQVLQQDDLEKGEMYDLFRKNGIDTTFNIRDKDAHKHLRRLISPAFSIKYLNSLETHMHDMLQNLLDKIYSKVGDHPEQGAVVDIWKLWQHLGLDVIGTTAFGQTFDMIKNESHPVPDSIASEMRWSNWIIAHPYLTKILTLGRPIKSSPVITDFMMKTIEARVTSGERRHDILQILLDTKQAEDPNDRFSDIHIITETILFLIAGSETTSNTLGFAVIELLRHPQAMKKLRDEIDTLEFVNPERHIFNHDQLKNLPYLNAVINETLRLDPMAANGIERRAEKDVTLGGTLFVPKGTGITCNAYHVHLNEKYWPNARSFEPERWLPNDTPGSVKPDLDAFYAFSIGSRNCIGKNFALMEMRLALSALIKLFDITAIPDEMEQANDIRHFVTLTVAQNKFNVILRPRRV
ncbi:cytochrome P450 [Halteromyces radiatus]|uniref:cytochrome P450 n=1 Tax=Halteromyces radiatus TaxID=101107 RepID=UPI0022207403|nr:cytochrome P450 [Halteromyces radiatus]KAI8079930.1 cytochrome P450 [Halteromyces radiatus]